MKKDVKYIWALQDVSEERTFGSVKYGILKGKRYQVYSEFESDKVSSGLCYVILTENGNFVGYDSEYFISDLEHESKRYNL